MNIKIRRGTHEIGGRCVGVYTRDTRILLDFGLPLVSPGNKSVPLDKSKLKGLDNAILTPPKDIIFPDPGILLHTPPAVLYAPGLF